MTSVTTTNANTSTNTSTINNPNTQLVEEYLASFNEHQHHVMSVAIEKLGSSFNVAKSNGFLKWKAKRSQRTQEQVLSAASTSTPLPLNPITTTELLTPTPTFEIPIITPPAPVKPVKKRLIVKRKTPTTSITVVDKNVQKSDDIQGTKPEQSKIQQTVYDKLSQILTTHSLLVPEPKILQSPLSTKTVITHETGSIYCIFTETELLYVGTTSDTKKNFPLAYKSTLKTVSTSTSLYGIIVPSEDNKQRIKVRDVIKKSLLLSQS